MRAVILGQHPSRTPAFGAIDRQYSTRALTCLCPPVLPLRARPTLRPSAGVKALAALFNQDDTVRIVAGVSDILDCGVVLSAQIPPVELLICGGYFDLLDVQDMMASVNDDNLRLLKVPDGLMMEGGGPPAVKAWVYEQIRTNTYTPPH
ncbi:hypothetical protein JCM11491_006708 [Sporobolomyces phaffii]